MAAPNRILTLNLGTQTISLAEFRPNANGGLTLNAYDFSELYADPASEASRLPQMKLAITGLLASAHIRKGPVNYAVSGQSVFTRFVKLPPLAEDKVDQIVTFEAQQNVPFPIDEVVWDYQLVAGGEENQVEVVLVAIKSDLLTELNDVVEDSGFRTNLVDIAPMALYNAFRYNYSDVSTGCSLIVDVGARTTNLIFIEPNKVFSRSIPIGGNTITTALAKEFNETFQAAEERKRRDGFVSLGGAYADPSDPEIARMSKIIRNTMTRLHAEIGRSISFYRAQQKGAQPTRLYLCGGSASLPYMKEFFQEKLQLPVDFFNPLRNVSISEKVNVDDVVKKAYLMGEVVGLALRSISSSPMELNLRPLSVIRQQELSRRKPYLLTAGACLVLLLTALWFYLHQAANHMEVVDQRVSQETQQLGRYEKELVALRGRSAQLQARAEPLLEALAERDYWVRLVDEVNSRLPVNADTRESHLWVTVLEPTRGGQPVTFASPGSPAAAAAPVTGSAAKDAPAAPPAVDAVRIRGLYLWPGDATIVDSFVDSLVASPYFNVNPEQKRDVLIRRTTPTQTEWAWDFELLLPLAVPIDLQ